MTSYKATRISLFSMDTAPMRAFHLTWMAFFVCFFAWFACAPLMPVIKQDLGLTTEQIANINIAAMAVTILVRLIIGPLCDRYGPRITYCGLLLLGSLPVFGVALVQSYEAFLFMRLMIGAVGASFVITQYHTSVMFAPNVVGTANATVAGWGNAGGGAVQGLMPLILGVSDSLGWRLSMIIPGVMMLLMAALYWRYTQDCPEGNYNDLRKAGITLESGKKGGWASFKAACRNYRVWLLFLTYGGSFGVEIFFHNMAAIYIVDQYGLTLKSAGMAVAGFGLLALFARALGGWFSDKAAQAGNVNSRTKVLFVFMLGEGLGLLAFANSGNAAFAIISMLIFGLFIHMACGATYAIVPFVDRKALGGVAGIIGAGGNVGAVAAGFLMKGLGDAQQTMLVLGIVVSVTALCALAVRLAPEEKTQESGLLAPAHFTA
jgi:NNP family nitrate/nitrite transporter-like MFS transporter